MTDKQTLKKSFIYAVIATFVVTAAIGIFAVALGSYNEILAKTQLSTIVIAIFSLTGLANLRNITSEIRGYRTFAWLSISFSFIATLLTLSLIWISLVHTPWRPTLVFMVLAVSTAHISMLIAIRKKSEILNGIIFATLFCISFVAGFLIYLIISQNSNLGQAFYRLLGVFVILDVLGTIVTPLLSRFVYIEKSEAENTSHDQSGTRAQYHEATSELRSEDAPHHHQAASSSVPENEPSSRHEHRPS